MSHFVEVDFSAESQAVQGVKDEKWDWAEGADANHCVATDACYKGAGNRNTTLVEALVIQRRAKQHLVPYILYKQL